MERELHVQAAVLDHVLDEVVAVFRMTLERLVIRVHDAEAFVVTLSPLEVVEQRPSVVAFERHAGLDQTVALDEVLAEIRRAFDVVHLLVSRQYVVVTSAVLRKVDRRIAVFLVHPREYVVKRFRVNVPANLRAIEAD